MASGPPAPGGRRSPGRSKMVMSRSRADGHGKKSSSGWCGMVRWDTVGRQLSGSLPHSGTLSSGSMKGDTALRSQTDVLQLMHLAIRRNAWSSFSSGTGRRQVSGNDMDDDEETSVNGASAERLSNTVGSMSVEIVCSTPPNAGTGDKIPADMAGSVTPTSPPSRSGISESNTSFDHAACKSRSSIGFS
jgi:hypothetical protein